MFQFFVLRRFAQYIFLVIVLTKWSRKSLHVFNRMFLPVFGVLNSLPAETLSILEFKLQILLCLEHALRFSDFLSTYRASEYCSFSTSLFGPSFLRIFWYLTLGFPGVSLSLWHTVPECSARDGGRLLKMEDSSASDYKQAVPQFHSSVSPMTFQYFVSTCNVQFLKCGLTICCPCLILLKLLNIPSLSITVRKKKLPSVFLPLAFTASNWRLKCSWYFCDFFFLLSASDLVELFTLHSSS